MSFGETITNLRKSKGITQEQLAETLGVTRQTISKWELDQSTPDLNYISQLSDLYGVTTDYLIKGEDPVKNTENSEAEELYEQIVGNSREEVKQIIYVNKDGGNGLTPRSLAGVIVAILAAVLAVVSMVMMGENEDWIIGAIFGAFGFIAGLEMVLVKKHPVLAVLWTIWIIVFLFLAVFLVNTPAGGSIFGFDNMGQLVNTVHLLYLIALIIGTVATLKKGKREM